MFTLPFFWVNIESMLPVLRADDAAFIFFPSEGELLAKLPTLDLGQQLDPCGCSRWDETTGHVTLTGNAQWPRKAWYYFADPVSGQRTRTEPHRDRMARLVHCQRCGTVWQDWYYPKPGQWR